MNVKTRVLLTGGVIGMLIGILAGWLYLNSAAIEVDEEGVEHIAPPPAGDALKMGLGVLGVLRQLSG